MADDQMCIVRRRVSSFVVVTISIHTVYAYNLRIIGGYYTIINA
jgi:hypothetical protein